MHPSPNAERTPSAGLQTLLADGLCLEDDEPQAGPVIVSGIRTANPAPCGRAFLLADDPEALIQSRIRHCTVDGYTSWPALAMAFEAMLRDVHAEARVMLQRGTVL
jgi:hypothetical protein